jgi:hypothetical protein
MYVNGNSKLRIGNQYAKTVKEFKYLGLVLSNSSRKPEALL